MRLSAVVVASLWLLATSVYGQGCSDAWLCGTTFEGAGTVASEPYGFTDEITDANACLQMCASRNTPGDAAVCNAVSVPIFALAGYSGCHMWLVDEDAEPLANVGFTSIKFKPSCIPDAITAATVSDTCGGGAGTPTTPTTAIPSGPVTSDFSTQHTLHPVIEVESLYLLPPGTTTKKIELQGAESHTHGPKDYLEAWTWTAGGEVVSTDVNYVKTFPIGTYTYELTVADQKGDTKTAATTFTIASEADAPGTYVRAYTGMSLAPLPDMPTFATAVPSTLSVLSSQYEKPPGDAFVLRLVGKIKPTSDFVPSFTAVATVPGQQIKIKGTKFLLNGLNPGTGTQPGGEYYMLDARILVTDLVSVQIELNGKPITLSKIDVSEKPPVINKVVSGNIAAAGGPGVIDGFLLRKPAVVTVGSIEAKIVKQTDRSIEFTYPPGLTGLTDILVVREGHASNVAWVEVKDYSQAGPQGGPFNPVPTFTQKSAKDAAGTGVHESTAVARVAWCNGHLFAASAYEQGLIWHYTCNEDWDCTFVDSKTVAEEPYQSILGLACDPWENDANTKLWFAHNHLYAQGGAEPTEFAEYKGRISYVEWFKPGKPVTLAVKHLAVSNHDHAVNDLGFLHDGDLLITTASNTNAGVVSSPLGYLPENPTATGLWRVGVRSPTFDGNLQYAWLPGAPAAYVKAEDPMDQRYGEWAQLVDNPDFTLFAGGCRNPFGLEIRPKGQVMMTQNGPNFDYGGSLTGMSDGCKKTARGAADCMELAGPDPAASDAVYLDVQEGDYYGSPNPSRCRKYLITGIGNPDECVFTNPNDIPTTRPACPGAGCSLAAPDIILESSLGGPFEYTSYAFGGAYYGQVFIPSLQSSSWRYNVESNVAVQDDQDANYPLSPGVDAQAGPGGAMIFASFSTNSVTINVPEDTVVSGHGNPTVYDMSPPKSAVGLSGKKGFIIGGANFENMKDVTVWIGPQKATVNTIGKKWIKGDLPVGVKADCDVDVAVTYTDTRPGVGAGKLKLPGFFCWLPAKPSACSVCM